MLFRSNSIPVESEEPDTLAQTNMESFYPKKLSWTEAVKIRSIYPSICVAIVEKIMMLDHRAPLMASSVVDTFANKIQSALSTECLCETKCTSSCEHNSPDFSTFHPMDIMNVIYNCCDNIVLQALFEKLFQFRASIPLLFPDSRQNHSTFSLWSLRSIVPDRKCMDVDGDAASLVDIPQTYIAFLRIGRLYASKSKFLNELLSPFHHDIFFHRNCDKGMSIRKYSNGTVEASWYFPGESVSAEFNDSFTLLNLRGDAADYKDQTEWLCRVANFTFIMISLRDLKNKSYVDVVDLGANIKTTLVVCFVADVYDAVKMCSKDLEMCEESFKEYNVSVFQQICNWKEARLLTDGEWKLEIITTMNNFLKNYSNQKSALTQLAKTVDKYRFVVDENDPLCREAYLKADKIIQSIQNIDPVKRKLIALPLQGELWKKWGHLNKEQHRNQIPENEIEKFIACKQSEQENVRLEQFSLITNNRSKFAYEFIQILHNLDDDSTKKYFANWIQIILNNWSQQIMPTLQNNLYNKLKEIRQKFLKFPDENTKN